MRINGNGGYHCHHCEAELVTSNRQWFTECDQCGSDNITNTLELDDPIEWEVTA